jgi:cell shape-determining protein MreD
MKRIFKNFRWAAFITYFFLFLVLKLIIDFFRGKFNETTESTFSILLGMLIEALLFSFIMSMLFGKKFEENKNNHEKN